MNRYLKVGNKYLGQIYGTKYDRYFWIDAEDFKEVCKYNWYYQPKNLKKQGDYGAIKSDTSGKSIFLHRLIMGESPDETRPFIDHIDHDVCNNCKENLRFVNSKENNNNRRKPKKKDKT